MLKIFLSTLLTLTFSCAYEDLGTYGQTFEIKERNFMEELNERATKVDKKKLEEQITKAIDKSLNIQSDIEACIQSKKRIYTPTQTATQDMFIPYTYKRIVKKGETYNILERNNVIMPYHLMFIDGTDEVQIELAKLYKSKLKQQMRILLVKGDFRKVVNMPLLSAIKIARQSDEIKAFNLKCLPSIYTQKNYSFEITEYNPEELKKEEVKND